MILDNSAYEFFVKGQSLDLDKYKEAIIELNPDYYILPDTLMNREKTIMDVLEFEHNQRREIEKELETAVQKGRSFGMSSEELRQLLDLILEDE